jgi:SulP family sulfate permease
MLPRANPGFTPKIFSTFRAGYGIALLRADIVAGLTVAVVALPLAMALGIASGASPDKGLITAVIAGFLISLLGGARVQIGGPTGAFVVVVFNVIALHGYDGLLIATFLAGIILIVAGYAKLGQIVKFIPHPVVTGFTAGIAVIIASSQVSDFLGLKISKVPADFIPKWTAYIGAANTISVPTVIVGAASLTTILLLRKFAPKLPGYLIAIVVAVLAVQFFKLPIDTIGTRFPNMPTGIPVPSIPVFSFDKAREALPSAFTIAFLAGIEALLSAVVADGMTGYRHRSNQELVGQGIANIASAFFGGLPATGAIARTATNIRAGGRTPVAGIMHAAFLFAFILFGGELMKLVPMAALAAILFMVAWGMSEYERFTHLLKMPSDDRVVLMLTFGLTVMVDLTIAIGVGVVLASLMFMSRMAKAVQIGSRENGDEGQEDDNQRAALPSGVEVFRITGPFFFGVASELLDTLHRIGERPNVFILRLRLMPFLDTTGGNALRDLIAECVGHGIRVIFAGTQPQPLRLLTAMGLGSGSPCVSHVPNYDDAISLALELRGQRPLNTNVLELRRPQERPSTGSDVKTMIID